MTVESDGAWDAFASLTTMFYAAARPAGARVADGWFAALSEAPNCELNVCGLNRRATRDSAAELAVVLGYELPAIIFVSENAPDDARAVLGEALFTAAATAEPLMRCEHRPSAPEGPFRIAPASSAREMGIALALTAEAHEVEQAMLAETIGVAAREGPAQIWLAWDDEDPVSALWLVQTGATIGLMELMTPERHQRRGAGRRLLTTALAETWTRHTRQAVLLSTPAGRRLYESVGFATVDESMTWTRGADDAMLLAIGQAI